MANAINSLGTILHPLTTEEFFARYHGRSMLHVPGDPEKFAGVMSWATLNALLDMDIWTPATLHIVLDRQPVPPEAFCQRGMNRNGEFAFRPKIDRVMGLVRQGASLVLNKIQTLTPELGAAARTLSETLGGRIGMNLYCSWEKHQAFNAHFDTHDVYVFHIEGEKAWNIYEGRMEQPIEHAAFDLPLERRNELKGRVLRQVVLKPGDFLYLPRGQFHDALATTPGSIHITCAINEPIGLDWLGALLDIAVQDPLFRADLPRVAGEAGQVQLAAHRRLLAERFAALANSPEALELMRAMRLKAPPALPRPYALPERAPATRYRVHGDGLKVVRRGSDWVLRSANANHALSDGDERIVAWVLERAHFTSADLAGQFASVEPAARERVIETLKRLAVLEAA